MNNQTPEERRGSLNADRERRDYTPPGRLRRIFFDHPRGIWAAVGSIVLLLVLFVGTTAFAVNERFKREVAEIAYNRDLRGLNFLLEQEAASLEEISDTVAALDSKVSTVAVEDQPYLVVSLADRRVWYLDGPDTLFTVPVAVGSGRTIVMGGKTHRFQTPRGRMTITHKERDPVWVPPDWHYHRIAQQRGLRVVNMRSASTDALTKMGFPPAEEPIRDGVSSASLGQPSKQAYGSARCGEAGNARRILLPWYQQRVLDWYRRQCGLHPPSPRRCSLDVREYPGRNPGLYLLSQETARAQHAVQRGPGGRAYCRGFARRYCGRASPPRYSRWLRHGGNG